MARPARGKKKEMDPELLMKKKFRAKCQFRALYRLVLANAYWLIEDVDHYEGVDDVKRRVQQAVRGKQKTKQLLTIRDKALLNKPAADRTDHEKKYLYRILGGLKCFKKYPNHVKRKLAAVTYFKYYGPRRVMVRENQDSYAMYFIVSGDLVITQKIWDGLLEEYIDTPIATHHAGDTFGEVSLLHDIPRTATVTTTDHCELLELLKEDFNNILLTSVQQQWDEVRHAMSAFTYFDALDEIGLRDGCIVAKMKSYEVNEIILGDGVEVANFVYFVLTGRCQMIETMQVIVTKRLGQSYFTLYDPYMSPEESEQDLDKKYFAGYRNLDQSGTSGVASTKEPSQESGLKTTGDSILRPESILKTSSSKQGKIVDIANFYMRSDSEKKASISSAMRGDRASMGEVILPPTESQIGEPPRDSVKLSIVPEIGAAKRTPAKPPNLKTFFMQVVQFCPGSSFGFGENMRDRRIIAMTPVTCLLLPQVWLFNRNTANIWTRIKYYLNKKIPGKKALFKEFVNERRWQEYRDQIVDDIVNACNTVNATSVHDVPYSIRLEEIYDV